MSALTDVVTGVIGGIGDAALKIRTAITGIDPSKQADLTQALAQMDAQLQEAQTAINQAEAASPNMFVAGWRPFIGWICGAAFALNFIVQPIAQWIIGPTVKLPELDLATMLPVLLGMLGLGAYRTVEKVQGVQSNH